MGIQGTMKNNTISEVLLTYGWIRSTYAALRNLSTHGIGVAICDTSRLGMCQLSHLKSNMDIYSNPYSKGEIKFINDICNIIEKRKIKILIPSHDETEVIAKYRNTIEKYDVIIPIHTYNIIHWLIINLRQ
jgi:hypothetical protein